MTHYHLLGVHRASTTQEIKDRFRELAAIHHPDRLAPETTDEERAHHADIFAKYSTAYAVLKGETSIVEYNKYLDLLYPRCSSCRGAGCLTKTIGFTKAETRRCESCGGSGIVQRRR